MLLYLWAARYVVGRMQRDPRLVLEVGSTRLEVLPNHGGRIGSLKYEGVELLWQHGAANFADATGSTFWPSPQRWPWPPPPELDCEPYEVLRAAPDLLALQSRSHADTQLRVGKTFAADASRGAIEITYAMTNVGPQPVSWAPWEVTRVPPHGLAFWPTGGEPFGSSPLPARRACHHTWCEPRLARGEGKLFADAGGGYLAYALDGYLLLKSFEGIDALQAAPGEAEIELYVNQDHSYVEIEQQGAYVSIAPGATVKWPVTWYARRLPDAPNLSDADLVAFVTETLQ